MYSYLSAVARLTGDVCLVDIDERPSGRRRVRLMKLIRMKLTNKKKEHTVLYEELKALEVPQQ